MPSHPCIVIPGIKGTGLENIYEFAAGDHVVNLGSWRRGAGF